MNKNLLVLLSFFLLVACTSTPKISPNATPSVEPVTTPEPTPSPVTVIILEKPMAIPENKKTSATNAVQDSLEEGIVEPTVYNGNTIFYDFIENHTYPIFCQPLIVTDIYLEPGEKLLGDPILGDTVRWLVGTAISRSDGTDIQHIYLKPFQDGLSTSMYVNTTRRVYHFAIKSFPNVYMAGVRFRYPLDQLPHDYITANGQIMSVNKVSGNTEVVLDGDVGYDKLTFKYKVQNKGVGKPKWYPDMVFDDGSKTYIKLPASVVNYEMPAVFDGNNKIVNYRVSNTVIIIDKLITTATLKLGKGKVVITNLSEVKDE